VGDVATVQFAPDLHRIPAVVCDAGARSVGKALRRRLVDVVYLGAV